MKETGFQIWIWKSKKKIPPNESVAIQKKKQTKYTYYYRVSHQYCPAFETLCTTCPATTAKPIFGISERIIKKCENKAFKSLHMYIKCH